MDGNAMQLTFTAKAAPTRHCPVSINGRSGLGREKKVSFPDGHRDREYWSTNLENEIVRKN
jgi:hypothetical protein